MEEQELVKKALKGNRKSLEILINSVKDQVYNIALRFLYNREDAEDATQEILVKVVTNLNSFKGKSKFKTWTFRIATNYLINLKKTRIEATSISFEMYGEDLKQYKAAKEYNLPDKEILENELKSSCTTAMLQCLNREHRVAFILGAILKVKSASGAEITGTTPENFRKRLQKSRRLLGNFMESNCGIYNPSNPCRCANRINTALKDARIQRDYLQFSKKVDIYNEEMEELHSLAAIYRNQGMFESKNDFTKQINELISTKRILQ